MRREGETERQREREGERKRGREREGEWRRERERGELTKVNQKKINYKNYYYCFSLFFHYQLELVRKELAWESEKHFVALKKLQKKSVQ